jgi:hypothetical protein
MPNRHRGEVPLHLGGRAFTLCLTLGALAELESAFGVADLAALGERFAGGRLSAGDLLKLLAVTLRGGGHAVTDAEVAALPVADGLGPIATALGELLVATFGDGSEVARRTPGEGGAQNPFPGAR